MRIVKLLLVFGALLLFIPSGFGQNTNMYFNGGYQGANWTYGSETVGTGFYDGSINNVQVGPNQPGGPGMICDDFKDNVYAGESWTASAVNASTVSSNLGALLFGNTIGVTGYTEVAYLVYQMFTTNPNAATEAAYSQAIWALTGGLPLSALGGKGSLALTLYDSALANWGGLTVQELATLWIYTPNPRGPNEAQEMWGKVAVPEGGSAIAYLLLAGICCFVAMFSFKRQQAYLRG